MSSSVCPDSQIIAIARDDDTTFSILHSRFLGRSLRLSTLRAVDNDQNYTPPLETFPFQKA